MAGRGEIIGAMLINPYGPVRPVDKASLTAEHTEVPESFYEQNWEKLGDVSRRAMFDAKDLMRIHLETLFTQDDAGFFMTVNEPGGTEAPRFFLGRTADGNVWGVRHDVDTALVNDQIKFPIDAINRHWDKCLCSVDVSNSFRGGVC